MRYKENARCTFFANGKERNGTIVGRVMKGRKTLSVQVIDDQQKLWNVASAKDLKKA